MRIVISSFLFIAFSASGALAFYKWHYPGVLIEKITPVASASQFLNFGSPIKTSTYEAGDVEFFVNQSDTIIIRSIHRASPSVMRRYNDYVIDVASDGFNTNIQHRISSPLKKSSDSNGINLSNFFGGITREVAVIEKPEVGVYRLNHRKTNSQFIESYFSLEIRQLNGLTYLPFLAASIASLFTMIALNLKYIKFSSGSNSTEPSQ